ncbi:hypothetical protein Fot_09753 [Forsythia ovata]|uniref:Uncharacterized protein n=1 Tax=Forsythia ovata TaxID=205694 RepID=A0ABD1WHM4_9LAMI
MLVLTHLYPRFAANINFNWRKKYVAAPTVGSSKAPKAKTSTPPLKRVVISKPLAHPLAQPTLQEVVVKEKALADTLVERVLLRPPKPARSGAEGLSGVEKMALDGDTDEPVKKRPRASQSGRYLTDFYHYCLEGLESSTTASFPSFMSKS